MTATRKPRAPRRTKLTEAQLLAAEPAPMPDRRTFLGGSDFAAVLGVSPWHTPVELWKLKRGLTEPKAISQARARALERGKKLEPVVLAMLLDKLREQGLKVELVARNQRYTDPEHPFLRVEIDFELRVTGYITISGEPYFLDNVLINGDAKTVTGFLRRKWGEEETEDVPTEYAAQFMGGLMVAPSQRPLCLCAALIGLDDVAIYWVLRDEETIAAMRAKLVSFWVEHVLTGRAPDPFKFSDIKELYPLDSGRTVEATPAVAALQEQLRAVRTELALKRADEQRLALEVGAYMEDCTTLTVAGRPVITFKTQESTTVDVDAMRRQHPDWVALYEKTTPTRVLRLSRR